MRNTSMLDRTLRLMVLGAALVTFGFAQMGGKGGGAVGGGMGSGAPGTSGISGVMSGIVIGMPSASAGPVTGADGTAYVLRATTATLGNVPTSAWELVAINPATGKFNWNLPLDGLMISDPVLGKDGTILLTATGTAMMSSVNAPKPALIIVAPSGTSARVQARISIDADMLSAPVMTQDGQTIYVVATQIPFMTRITQAASAGSTFLYAFFPGTGALKFKVQLR